MQKGSDMHHYRTQCCLNLNDAPSRQSIGQFVLEISFGHRQTDMQFSRPVEANTGRELAAKLAELRQTVVGTRAGILALHGDRTYARYTPQNSLSRLYKQRTGSEIGRLGSSPCMETAHTLDTPLRTVCSRLYKQRTGSEIGRVEANSGEYESWDPRPAWRPHIRSIHPSELSVHDYTSRELAAKLAELRQTVVGTIAGILALHGDRTYARYTPQNSLSRLYKQRTGSEIGRVETNSGGYDSWDPRPVCRELAAKLVELRQTVVGTRAGILALHEDRTYARYTPQNCLEIGRVETNSGGYDSWDPRPAWRPHIRSIHPSELSHLNSYATYNYSQAIRLIQYFSTRVARYCSACSVYRTKNISRTVSKHLIKVMEEVFSSARAARYCPACSVYRTKNISRTVSKHLIKVMEEVFSSARAARYCPACSVYRTKNISRTVSKHLIKVMEEVFSSARAARYCSACSVYPTKNISRTVSKHLIKVMEEVFSSARRSYCSACSVYPPKTYRELLWKKCSPLPAPLAIALLVLYTHQKHIENCLKAPDRFGVFLGVLPACSVYRTKNISRTVSKHLIKVMEEVFSSARAARYCPACSVYRTKNISRTVSKHLIKVMEEVFSSGCASRYCPACLLYRTKNITNAVSISMQG
ncbi:hypothetical protein J6590_068502 [Homalodisca vitripennis]|nr:hypothetical protein J6590_068502 [Homalodisca vitripennis]